MSRCEGLPFNLNFGGERKQDVMKKQSFWIWTMIFLILPQLGWAQGDGRIENTFGIGPRAGFYKSKDADEGAWYGGVQARFRLGEVIGLEVAADYRSEETFEVDSPTFSGEINQRSYPVTASLLVFLPILPHFSPYLVGGGGIYYTKIDYSDSLEDLGFDDRIERPWGWHVGGGLEIPFTETVAINADVRYIFMDSEFGREGTTNLDEDRSVDGWVGTAALMFYF